MANIYQSTEFLLLSLTFESNATYFQDLRRSVAVAIVDSVIAAGFDSNSDSIFP
jgi:hypothetical protein